jgi:PLD-like domain
MTTAHFTNLPSILTDAIRAAKSEIHIAVCWFTLPEVFDALVAQQQAGVKVQFIINFDQLNFSPTGLPFGKIINMGAKGFGYVGHGLLHHKYVVIDRERVLSGSFNWTRSQHNDCLTDVSTPSVSAVFLDEWQRLLHQSKPLETLDARQARPLSIAHLFQPNFWNINDLRRHLIRGASVWLAQMDVPHSAKWSRCFGSQTLFLPIGDKICRQAVAAVGTWHHQTLMQFVETLEIPPQGAAYAQAKLFCRRAHDGDIVLAIDNQSVIGIGVVMSEVLFDEHRGLHCAVEWQVLSPSKPFQWGKLSKKPIARLVGGGLAVVDALLR